MCLICLQQCRIREEKKPLVPKFILIYSSELRDLEIVAKLR